MALDKLKRGTTYDLWDESTVDEEKARKLASKRQKKEPHLERAVKLPHPGQSYNPAPEDHQRLLASVAKEEIKFLNKDKNLNEALSSSVSADKLERDEHNELMSGIGHLVPKIGGDKKGDSDAPSDQEEEDQSDGFCSDYGEADFDAMLKDRAVREKRKTTAQRMRQLRDKLQRKHAKLRKMRNIRLDKFNHIKNIKKQLDEHDRLRLLHRRRVTRRRTQRFSQKFERSDPIYCLPGDLPSNLRLVKCPVDAMLRERMESFQARNLVEPTNVQVPRLRYPRKKFERRNADNKISDDLQFESAKKGQQSASHASHAL